MAPSSQRRPSACRHPAAGAAEPVTAYKVIGADWLSLSPGPAARVRFTVGETATEPTGHGIWASETLTESARWASKRNGPRGTPHTPDPDRRIIEIEYDENQLLDRTSFGVRVSACRVVREIPAGSADA